MAELARVASQDDRYRGVFRQAPAPAAPTADEHHWQEDAAGAHDPARYREHGTAEDMAADGGSEGWHDHAGGGESWPEHDEAPDQRHASVEDERYYAVEAASHRDDAGIAEAGTAADGAEASIPDLWAQGGPADHGRAPAVDGSHAPEFGRTRGGGSARRPLLVLGAVLLLTGGGLGAAFLAKGNNAASVVTTNGSGAPTILAATGPTKVKQGDPSATAPEDKDAALLNKGAVGGGPAKVVQSEEQPADLSQLPKADDGTAVVQTPPQGLFPEAKKVKTFVVHPDGTPLYDDGQAAANAAPPSAATPAPLASTPNAAGKGVATPSATTIASLVADNPSPADAAPAPLEPVAAAPKSAKTKPNASAGGFGLQLAASPSEAEAHAAFAKLKKKYPAELGSLSANVHQSETGGKPVYRVRVGGMTREEASTLCSKLMAGGGSCFVVHD